MVPTSTGGAARTSKATTEGLRRILRGIRRRPSIIRLCGAGEDDGQMSLTMHTAAERPDLWERGIESAMA